KVLHRLFGQRIVLALHVADAEIELVLRRGAGRQRGQRGAGAWPGAALWRRGCRGRRQGATRVAWTAEMERRAWPTPSGRPGCRFARHRHLAAAERARCPRGVGILAGIEGITATAAAGLGGCRVLYDRRGRGDLRLLVVAGLGLRIALL